MTKRVILLTGTPCVGKTTLARKIAAELDALYINLTEFAKTHDLLLGEDKQRETTIIDEANMRKKICQTIKATEQNDVIIDGHYAAAVVSKELVTRVFVLRRNPVELRKYMEKCGFQGPKLWENLAAEILDVCLVEALREHENDKVCELDVTGKKVEEVAAEINAVLDGRKKCYTGFVDWLGMLEKEGLTSQYLKV
jgi:adenylate kinase